MKVLHIVGFYPEIGGPYTVVRDMTKELVRNGCSVSVYSPLPQAYDKSKLEDNNHLNELKYFESRGIQAQFWPSYSPEWANNVDKINSYDLIHVHGLFDYYAHFIARNIDKPYVVSLHGSLLNAVIHTKSRLRKMAYLHLVGKSILNNSSGIHLLTEREASDLRKLEINQKLFSVIPNGIDVCGSFSPPPKGLLFKKYPHLREKKLVLFLGRINWIKGIDDLIPAFADVVKIANDAHLVLVGPDSEGYMNEVNKLVEIHNLKKDVSYFGPVYGEEKIMFMQDCDIFVLPSFSEAFPATALEAMSIALPVILTEDSGIPHIIKEANAGLVIRKNKKEISSAIVKLMNDKLLSTEMGRNGQILIKTEFLWNKIASNIIDLYQMVLKTQRSHNYE